MMEPIEISAVIVPSRPFLTAQPVGLCPDCRGLEYVDVHDDHDRVIECPTCSPIRARVARFNDARVPARFSTASFATLRIERIAVDHQEETRRALKAARGFAEHPIGIGETAPWLLFCGPCGVGKTHLMAALIRSLAFQQAIGCAYLALPEVFSALRGGGSGLAVDGDAVASLLDVVSSVPVLFLDEVGVGRTEWEVSLTSRIICRRYDSDLAAVFASNCFPTPDGLRDRLHETAISRLLGGHCQVLPMRGTDQRRP